MPGGGDEGGEDNAVAKKEDPPETKQQPSKLPGGEEKEHPQQQTKKQRQDDDDHTGELTGDGGTPEVGVPPPAADADGTTTVDTSDKKKKDDKTAAGEEGKVEEDPNAAAAALADFPPPSKKKKKQEEEAPPFYSSGERQDQPEQQKKKFGISTRGKKKEQEDDESLEDGEVEEGEKVEAGVGKDDDEDKEEREIVAPTSAGAAEESSKKKKKGHRLEDEEMEEGEVSEEGEIAEDVLKETTSAASVDVKQKKTDHGKQQLEEEIEKQKGTATKTTKLSTDEQQAGSVDSPSTTGGRKVADKSEGQEGAAADTAAADAIGGETAMDIDQQEEEAGEEGEVPPSAAEGAGKEEERSPAVVAAAAAGAAEEADTAGDDLAEEEEEEEGQLEEEEEVGDDDDKMQSYSTRGRAGEPGGGGGGYSSGLNDPLERLAREALGELIRLERPPSATSALRESFLSDSITEEERRTRTRYIPAVDGMHALRKGELKADLALARSNVGGGGGSPSSTAVPAGKPKRGNSMDVEGSETGAGGDDAASMSDDDRASDIVRVGTKSIEMGGGTIVVPSTAFLAPPASSEPKAGTAASKAPPNEVDCTTAFNPPRPPESIGPKKRHRMLRWERRPADIEVDLNNYRKTVHRTREELKNAQAELQRLESVDNHLRRNFLLHLQSMGEEWKFLNKELSAVQQECIDSAQLLTSRTRSRVAGKSNYAMRDVLTVLRTKGQDIEARGISLATAPSLQEGDTPPPSGIGGLGSVSLEDWDRSTVINPAPIASSWTLPGDAVHTPYGDGTVVAVYGEGKLDVNEPPHSDLRFGPQSQADSGDRMDIDGETAPPRQGASSTKAGAKSAGVGKAGGKKGSKSKRNKDSGKQKTSPDNVAAPLFPLAPRVAVRLPFGVGFFPVGALVSKEDPSAYTDSRLALRWRGMVESALAMGSTLDIEAMAEVDPQTTSDLVGMEIEEGGGSTDPEQALGGGTPRLLPFGSGMFPTMAGRGNGLWKLGFEELDKVIDSTMYSNGGVLGLKMNTGVPPDVRKQEDDRQELLNLRAQVLQLKNQLYRQRRVRMLNERTYAGAEERAIRVEALVAEMRTDLKTLKGRLDEEVAELGISEDVAERLLTSFYESFDCKDEGEPSPHKRQRRLSRAEAEEDDLDDEDEENVDAAAVDVAAS